MMDTHRHRIVFNDNKKIWKIFIRKTSHFTNFFKVNLLFLKIFSSGILFDLYKLNICIVFLYVYLEYLEMKTKKNDKNKR
jgi:hypothetical protein